MKRNNAITHLAWVLSPWLLILALWYGVRASGLVNLANISTPACSWKP